MDADEFARLKAQLEAKWGPGRFENFKNAFNAEMRKKGDGRTFEDYMQSSAFAPEPEPQENPAKGQLEELVKELRDLTADDDPKTIILRGLGLYRSIVRHVKAGGTVKFVGADGTEKTLKVRLR